MIARHETGIDRADLWAKIAAALPAHAIEWRQDGRPTQRGGKHYARFIAYVTAQFVRERLDGVVPGEWDLTTEILPPMSTFLAGEVPDDAVIGCKARVQILGVIREDVGQGRDFKSAATDAFKRAAMRFGIGHELYAFEQNWVEVDGDGKFAKPVEDPGAAYARRHGNGAAVSEGEQRARPTSAPVAVGATASTAPAGSARSATASTPAGGGDMPCPKCGGKTWDNRATKRSPKAPDYKCRDRACDGVVWPPKGDKPAPSVRADQERHAGLRDDELPEYDDSDLPY